MTSDYPEIESLAQAVKKHQLRLSVDPPEPELQSLYYRHVVVRNHGVCWRVPVVDEEQDIDAANPVWLLDRVLRECEWFETSQDYLVWAKDLGFEPADRIARKVYFELREVSPQIRAYLGPEVQSIPNFDEQLNTDLMRALRCYEVEED